MILRILFLSLSLTLMGCFGGAKSSLNAITAGVSTEDGGDFAKGPGVSGDKSCEIRFATEEKTVGEFSSEIQDNFSAGTHSRRNFLTTLEGSRLELIGDIDLESVSIGDTIEVKGNNQGLIRANTNGIEQLHVSSLKVMNSKIQQLSMKDYSLKILTIVMDFNNRESSKVYSVARGKADLEKLKKYAADNSGGQMDFNIDANGDGSPDVELIKINRNFGRGDCTPRIGNNVDLAGLLQNHKTSDYDTIIYVASPGLSGNDPICGYGGVANVGSLGSGKNGGTHVAIPKFNVILHELGHTWGLGHSGRPGVTYAHTICPMGNSFADNVTHFNAPKTLMLGLMDNRPELRRTLTDNGTYEIEAIGHGVSFSEGGTLPRVITVKSGSKTYYLEHRFKVGEDADAPSQVSKFIGLNITEASLSRGGVSSYLAVLNSSGQSYNFSGGKVELVEGATKETLKFKLTFDNPSENPPYEGSKCDNTKVTSSLVSVANQPGYEVVYKIENNNDLECGALAFNIGLDSKVFQLEEIQVIKVAAGKKVEVKSKLKVKNADLLKLTGNSGIINAVEKDSKVGKQSIPFAIDKKAEDEC